FGVLPEPTDAGMAFLVLFVACWIVRIPVMLTEVKDHYGANMNLAQRIDNYFGCCTIYGLFGLSAVALLGVGAFLLHLAIMPHVSLMMIADAVAALFGHSQRGFWLKAFVDFGYIWTFSLAIISPVLFAVAWLYIGWRSLVEHRL